MLKIRRSRDCVIFNMGIPIPGKDGLCIGTHAACGQIPVSMSIKQLRVTNAVTMLCAAGLDMDGLYRVSGNLAQIQKLRFMVDHSE